MIKKSQVSRLRPAGRVQSSGFTLVELMIVMVVVAIGVALATPSFENIAQRRQTTSEAEQLAAFLSIAQSEAVKRNEMVRISLIHDDVDDWCVGAATATGTSVCDCKVSEDLDTTDDPNTDTFCDIGGVLHVMNNSAFDKSTMAAFSADTDGNFAFDPIRGSMSAADLADNLGVRSFAMESTNGDYRLQVEITVVGRIRICNPVSTQKVPGYPDC